MFPVRDDNPTLGHSLATLGVIGGVAACWVGVQDMGSGSAMLESLCRLGAIPAELLGRVDAGTRIPLGPEAACLLTGEPAPLTLVSHMFLHGGWFHLLGNLWFLWVFGDNVEDSMGPLRFALFYLLCGLAAVAAQIASSPDSTVPMVGASGAIGGVMGAYARLYPRAPVHVLLFLVVWVQRVVLPAFVMLGYWFFLQILGGIPSLASEGGGVAFWAHAGGFLAGLILVGIFADPRRLAAHRELIGRRAARWRRA